jgi:hypothetical protein
MCTYSNGLIAFIFTCAITTGATTANCTAATTCYN